RYRVSEMTTLTRTVRFAINPPEAASSSHGDTGNGYGGRPAMRGLGRHYELDITCVGEPDAATGYLINIKHIDSAVRERAVPLLERACRGRPGAEPAELLPELLAALSGAIAAPVTAVRWRLTPYYCVEMHTAAPERFLMRQQFDFAAAHRLHVDSLSDAQNREIFGRCNNPSSHGHNYRLEPVVEAELSSRGAPAMTLA